jgi:hypothetical protein
MPPRSAKTPAKVVAAEPKWLRHIIIALGALMLIAYTSVEVGDPDAWWHLKTGQYMLQQHRLPWPDPFSYTTYMGKPAYPGEEQTRYFNLTHEWLAQIVLYGAYATGGYAGLILFRSAMLTAFCALMGLAVYARVRSFWAAVIAALLAASTACQFTADRPYLFTFVFLGATVAILEWRRGMWFLPALFVLWANTHGGFFMGWVVLGAYCGEALFLRLRGKPPEGEKQLWMVAIASILASGLNPNGFRVIPVMIAYRKSLMQATLWEWQYPAPWPPSPFISLLAGALIIMIWARRRARPRDWLLLLTLGPAAMLAVRNIFLAALVGPLLIVSYLPLSWKLPSMAEHAAALILVALVTVRIAVGESFQFAAADWKYPAAAADFINSHHITGRMFNTYEIGGYLVWRVAPELKTFIDGRALNESVYFDYQLMAFNAAAQNGKKSGEELLRDYGIDVIVMDGFEFNTGKPYLLPAALSDPSQKEWKLVYQDAQAVIYMKNPPPGVQPLNNFDALASFEQQCQQYVEHSGGQTACTGGLAHLFQTIGDTPRAQRWRMIAAKYGH